MLDRIAIHNMIPEDPAFWRAEVDAFLLLPREQQLAVWRQKRALLHQPTNGFDEYGIWCRYLSNATATPIDELVPPEILAEEAAEKK